MQKIAPFLWFDDQAEEAVRFYTSIFKHSKILAVARYDEVGAKAAGRPKGSIMTISFEIEGQEFIALNGGPVFTFSPATSFVVNCRTQKEIDRLWEKLSEGGKKDRCGWLRDKYGVSWQIVPAVLGKMLQEKDPKKFRRVMEAILKMNKIDIEALMRAYKGQ